jgi:type IV pilus assembly protein PilY1
MVFRNVNIPQGAEIISAHLKIRSYDSHLTDNVYGKIEAEAVDDAMAFGGSHHIGSLPRTATSVDWDLDEPWSANTWYDSPDIADVIQEVVDRDGWSIDNSLAILYGTRQPKGGNRFFSSYDYGDNSAPKLEVTYRLN